MLHALVNMANHTVEMGTNEMCRFIARDVVLYKSGSSFGSKSTNKYGVIMNRIVDGILDKHALTPMVKQLEPISVDNLPTIFINVAESMFDDCQYNWGRVTSLFAFASALAGGHKMDNSIVLLTAQLLGDYVAVKLGPWISKQGGWDAFERFSTYSNLKQWITMDQLMSRIIPFLLLKILQIHST